MNKSTITIIAIISFTAIIVISAISIIYYIESPAQPKIYSLRIEYVDLTGSGLDDNMGKEEINCQVKIGDVIKNYNNIRGIGKINMQREFLFKATPNQPITLEVSIQEIDWLDPYDTASGELYIRKFSVSQLNTIMNLKDENGFPIKVGITCREISQ